MYSIGKPNKTILRCKCKLHSRNWPHNIECDNLARGSFEGNFLLASPTQLRILTRPIEVLSLFFPCDSGAYRLSQMLPSAFLFYEIINCGYLLAVMMDYKVYRYLSAPGTYVPPKNYREIVIYD